MLDQLSACPSCAEPLKTGDRFCGACGADLAATRQAPVADGQQPPAGGAGATPAGAAAPPQPVAPTAPPVTPPAGPVPPPPPAPPVPPLPEFRTASTPPANAPGAPPAPPQTVPPAPAEAAPGGPPPPSGPAASPAVPPVPAVPPTAGQPGQVPPAPGQSGHPAPSGGAEGDFTLAPAASQASRQSPGGDDFGSAPPPPPAAAGHREDGEAAQPASGQPAPAQSAQPQQPDAGAPSSAGPRVTVDDAPASVSGAAPTPGGTPAPLCVACGTGGIDGDGYCEHCGHKQPRERDHMECELASVAAASDRGLRHHRNEDFFSLDEAATVQGTPAVIAVVCDGVSSATRPDDASAAAAKAASASLREGLNRGTQPQQAMHGALLAAAEAVTALAAEGPNEPSKNAPACTIVSTLSADGILTVGWIGDSRAYWVPEDRSAPAVRLTEDDSWAAQMVAAGLMSEDEAYADARAHAITGWLGADAYELDPHTASFRPDSPGVVVVCTDGLWNYAESAEQMAAVLPADAGTRPLQSAQRLVGYALDGGGHDNVTVAVLPFRTAPGGQPQG